MWYRMHDQRAEMDTETLVGVKIAGGSGERQWLYGRESSGRN